MLSKKSSVQGVTPAIRQMPFMLYMHHNYRGVTHRVVMAICVAVTSSFFTGCTSHWPPAVTDLQGIDALPLSQTDVRCIGLSAIEIERICTRLTKLTYLFCNDDCQLTDQSLKQIGTLQNLNQLVIGNASETTDDGVQELLNCGQLRYLMLKSCSQLTDESLISIGRISRLKILHLEDSPGILGAGLANFGKLPSLSSVSLQGCVNLTDEGLAHLAKISTLESVYLDDCTGITDQGIQQLKKLKALKILWVNDCGLSEHAVAEVAKALPSCEVSGPRETD